MIIVRITKYFIQIEIMIDLSWIIKKLCNKIEINL